MIRVYLAFFIVSAAVSYAALRVGLHLAPIHGSLLGAVAGMLIYAVGIFSTVVVTLGIVEMRFRVEVRESDRRKSHCTPRPYQITGFHT